MSPMPEVVPTLPDPLVPAYVDLRNFQYMPLDVVRLVNSRLTAISTDLQFKTAVILWCKAWHQVPAASLPNDELELAMLSGFGHIVARSKADRRKIDTRSVASWRQVLSISLHGFVLCSDGRLYHPVIAEKAIEAWEQKQKQRRRTQAATEARQESRQRNVERNVQREEQHQSHQGNGTERKLDTGTPYLPCLIPKEDSRERKKIQKKERPLTALEILSQALTGKTAQDVIDHRKALKKPLTPRAAEGLITAFNAFGDPERAAEAMITNGWQGFKPEWLDNQAANGNGHAKPAGRSNGLAGYARLVYEDIERDRMDAENGQRNHKSAD